MIWIDKRVTREENFVFIEMTRRATQLAFAVLGVIALVGLAACSSPPASSTTAAPAPVNATPVAATAAEHPELGEAAVTEDALTVAVATHLQAEAAPSPRFHAGRPSLK